MTRRGRFKRIKFPSIRELDSDVNRLGNPILMRKKKGGDAFWV